MNARMTHEQWVRDGQRVAANYATGDGPHATGRVIAYTTRPTVTIITDDGRHVSWIADLCAPINDSMPSDATLREAARALRIDLLRDLGRDAEADALPPLRRETGSQFFPECKAEQHRGELAYRCILSEGHQGPHGRLVPEPTWWTGNDDGR